MNEEKKETKNQVVLGKVEFIQKRGWKQFRPGNQAKDLVWKDPKTQTPFNLETAYETEKIRDKEANATAKPDDPKQGVKNMNTPLDPSKKGQPGVKEKTEKAKK